MKHILFSLFFIPVLFLTANNRQNRSADDFHEGQFPGSEEKLLYPSVVNKFYALSGNKLFWMQPGKEADLLRHLLLKRMDSAYYWGQIEKKYHEAALRSYADSLLTDTLRLRMADRVFTDAAIAICKDVYQGYKQKPWVGYDQLSAKYEEIDNEYLLQKLLTTSSAGKFQLLLESLLPANKEYITLQDELRKQQEKKHTDTVAMLQLSMNYYRWIHHFQFEKMIVINLPEARLRYYEKDSILLNMKTVVGKTATPTPRFATVCDQVILYPYWYVPRSITFNEYLPKIKKNPAWIDANNMQVIDGSGKVIDHMKLDWSSFHTGYFPYTIRQSTGCDNALGVVKFNIVTPYGVYLHDTNNKTVFLSGLRYYSHGCIRIEEPFDLGNKLLGGKLDTAYLQSCFKEMKPEFTKLEKPVPVFSVYMRAMADSLGNVRYYKDVYKLID